ncbi:MAG: ACT domain-containing protein [Desulfobacterales bacterium]|nr:ACT domain-containing protein [Desulfobacterales bacterium]MDD4072798.1 ACT domain-containing protein [Desulfobacterales bacterium]MDD4393354.1 ACT domain-containing protein [Desulfobacterales bacterium]
MRVQQISIFLENKSGRLADVTSILTEAGINIRALSLADTSDFGVLRMIVDDTKKAETFLKNRGFTVGKTDVVAVEVEDKPGGLHKIMETFQQTEINIEYMYAFVQQSGNNAVIIFRFDNIDEAIHILTENGIRVIDGKSLYSL